MPTDPGETASSRENPTAPAQRTFAEVGDTLLERPDELSKFEGSNQQEFGPKERLPFVGPDRGAFCIRRRQFPTGWQ